MITGSEPVFATKDVPATLAFYRDVLGGQSEWLWGEPPEFGGIRLGQCQLLFSLQPDLADRVAGLEHFFRVDAVDALHEQHQSAGAEIAAPLGNRPWGAREYVVRDPNGYLLRFTGPPVFEPKPSSEESMPKGVEIVARLPRFEEYQGLKQAVNWSTEHDQPDRLQASCAGVTAMDSATGQAVGMARAVYDAHGWYSVWDVVVEPAYQNKKIGAALMSRLLDELRAQAEAGAKVYLFTYQHEFYAKLGFDTKSCTMIEL